MRAAFLDRDGVINELIYHSESGIIDSPFTVTQFRLLQGVTLAIKKLRDMGFMVVLVSNQPGIAKGHFTEKTFNAMRKKMKNELARDGVCLDGEYYCLHHPEAKNERLRVVCECRKPKPGLILRAAKDGNVDLSQSWMIGDSLIDIQAGKSAGTKTILVGPKKCEICRLMDELDARPDAVVADIGEGVSYLENISRQGG